MRKIKNLDVTLLQDGKGGGGPNPKACNSCAFAFDSSPSEHDITEFVHEPAKEYFYIYPRDQGMSKPKYIYYDGADCLYYEDMK